MSTHRLKLIQDFIAENFLFGRADVISDSASLIEGGVLDSTGILELVTFVESTFDITVADDEILPENLGSIAAISQYVDRRLSTAG